MSEIRRRAGYTLTHRYWLRRTWEDALPSIAWVMLNPSTADDREDDATIRRCMDFARSWGYGGIEVVNVYNLRATDPRELPRELWKAADRMGTWGHFAVAAHLNQWHIERAVCAWGARALPADAYHLTHHLLKAGIGLSCLGRNKGGSPKHPLYLAKTTPPEAYHA